LPPGAGGGGPQGVVGVIVQGGQAGQAIRRSRGLPGAVAEALVVEVAAQGGGRQATELHQRRVVGGVADGDGLRRCAREGEDVNVGPGALVHRTVRAQLVVVSCATLQVIEPEEAVGYARRLPRCGVDRRVEVAARLGPVAQLRLPGTGVRRPLQLRRRGGEGINHDGDRRCAGRQGGEGERRGIV